MNETYRPPQLTLAIRYILIVTIGIYVLQILPAIGRFLVDAGALVPVKVFRGGQLWRLFTYMFMHDPTSPFHLLFNMLALWMFGQEIEAVWGTKRFAWFYIISGVGSGCFSCIHLFSPVMSQIGVIGASGAILALLTVYAAYHPDRQVLLFFVIPINIKIVVIGYALISLFGTLAPRGVISHVTHLGGIVVAIVYLRFYADVFGFISSRKELRRERTMRRNAETAASEKRFFEENIDPVLEKISREGRGALSAQEEKLLRKFAKSGTTDMAKQKKIIPFDLFR